MKHLSKTELWIFGSLSALFLAGIGLSFLASANDLLNHGIDRLSLGLAWALASAHLWVLAHPLQAALALPLTVLAVFLWQAQKARRYF